MLIPRLIMMTLLLGTGLAVWLILQEPITVPTATPPIKSASQKSDSTPTVVAWNDLSRFESLKMQAPLYPPEVKPVIVEPPPLMQVNVQLLGIILEKDRQQAMISTPQGNVRFVNVGDYVDLPANRQQVATIAKDHIVVTQGEQQQTLSLEQMR